MNNHRQTRARLYLEAVWPAMADLVVWSPQAREIIKTWNLEIRLGVWRKVHQAVYFQGEEAQRGICCKARKHRLWITALTNCQFNRFFEGSGWALPMIYGSLCQLPKLKKLKELSLLLKRYLEPDADALQDSQFAADSAAMTLGVLVRSAAAIVKYEKESLRLAEQLPSGTAKFRIYGARPVEFWITVAGGQQYLQRELIVRQVSGSLASTMPSDISRQSDVEIIFHSPQSFIQMAQDKLDFQATVGLGQITLRGFLPLADGVGAIMERVGYYL